MTEGLHRLTMGQELKRLVNRDAPSLREGIRVGLNEGGLHGWVRLPPLIRLSQRCRPSKAAIGTYHEGEQR